MTPYRHSARPHMRDCCDCGGPTPVDKFGPRCSSCILRRDAERRRERSDANREMVRVSLVIAVCVTLISAWGQFLAVL